MALVNMPSSALPTPARVLSAAYTGSINSGRDGTCGDFPSPVDGSLILSDQYVGETAAPRGDIPGHKYCPQNRVWDSFKMFDLLAFHGRKYISSSSSISSSSTPGTSSNTGASFIDITGPWRV